MTNKPEFDPKAYWEQRLSESYGPQGVGHVSLGSSFNRWAYRARRHAYRRMVRPLLGDRSATRVLDVGSGTGFYIDRWRELGIDQIVGLDLTETAVSHLRTAYPGLTFVVADIGADSLPLEPGSFDFVSAFDIFYHIVDDQAYGRAIRNVFSLLKPGGYFVWSDMFLQSGIADGDPAAAGRSGVSRSLDMSTGLLRSAGFEIVSRRPLLWLMNTPADSTSRLLHSWWRHLMSVVRRGERAGNIVGALVFPVELALIRVTHESPTMEIMVCRKPAAG
jgi:SAM-dependent methyltransferase